jgi:hypothetical protein
MQSDALTLSMFCNAITVENISYLPKLVPNPTLIHVLDFIEKFKADHQIPRLEQESFAVGVKIDNPFDQPVFNVAIHFAMKAYLPDGDCRSFKFSLPLPHIDGKESIEVLLLDLSGLPKALFKVEGATFVRSDGTTGNRQRGSFPYLIDIAELTNEFGGFKDQSERETYYLIENYAKESVYARGWLLTILNKALEEVNNEKFSVKGKVVPLRGSELAKTRSIIQVDIISKIMLYIEDSVTLLIGNRTPGQNFYDFLDKNDPDLGKRVTNFFNEIETITNEDYRTMLCYADVEKLEFTPEEKKVVKKLIDHNIDEIKNHLRQNKRFRDTHVQVFRRYKHAGLAMRLGGETNAPYPYTNKKFDSQSMVFAGEDPMKDAIPIPYSMDVMTSYEIMVSTVQKIILDIVDNKLGCLHRRIDGLIPLEMYGPLDNFSLDEIRLINAVTEKFYTSRPFRAINNFFQLNSPVRREQIEWYVELDKYLTECKTKGKMERNQNKYLRDKGL